MTAELPLSTKEHPVFAPENTGREARRRAKRSFRDQWLVNKGMTASPILRSANGIAEDHECTPGLLLYTWPKDDDAPEFYSAYFEDAEIISEALGVMHSDSIYGGPMITISRARTIALLRAAGYEDLWVCEGTGETQPYFAGDLGRVVSPDECAAQWFSGAAGIVSEAATS